MWREDVSNLFALGLFRLAPHLLKPQIYDAGSWQARLLYPPQKPGGRDPRIKYKTRTDLAVFDELVASASADGTAPRFRFLHFFGAHRPISVDKSCRFDGTHGHSRSKDINATHCVLSQLFAFLHKLDEIGVYDQSVIFVLADHGNDAPLDVSVASPALPENEIPSELTPKSAGPSVKEPWRGVPLFLAKPLGDRQPLRISDLPVSLCDVPMSVIDALSIEGNFECESIFSVRNPRQTPRIHYRYPTVAERRELGLDGLTFEKHSVQGHSWLPDSWTLLSVHAE
jgi:hypothetical protein